MYHRRHLCATRILGSHRRVYGQSCPRHAGEIAAILEWIVGTAAHSVFWMSKSFRAYIFIYLCITLATRVSFYLYLYIRVLYLTSLVCKDAKEVFMGEFISVQVITLERFRKVMRLRFFFQVHCQTDGRYHLMIRSLLSSLHTSCMGVLWLSVPWFLLARFST